MNTMTEMLIENSAHREHDADQRERDREHDHERVQQRLELRRHEQVDEERRERRARRTGCPSTAPPPRSGRRGGRRRRRNVAGAACRRALGAGLDLPARAAEVEPGEVGRDDLGAAAADVPDLGRAVARSRSRHGR